jgi:hypothetical protein
MLSRSTVLFAFAALSAALTMPAPLSAAESPAGAQPVLSGKLLEAAPREVLLELALASGLSTVKVIAVGRTPLRQAEVMYDQCQKAGVDATRQSYSRQAEKVLDVFEEGARKPRAVVVEAMRVEIERLVMDLGPDRTTLRLVHADRYAFDISIAESGGKEFLAAARAHPDVLRVLPPAASTPASASETKPGESAGEPGAG